MTKQLDISDTMEAPYQHHFEGSDLRSVRGLEFALKSVFIEIM